MKNKRIVWVDICKAICIFAVMINHAQFSQAWIRVDYFFLVGFFFCSGYTFNIEHGLKQRLVRVVDSLIIPYLIMSFVMWFPLYRHILALMSKPVESLMGLMQDIVFGYSMWFIPCLIVTELVYAIALKLKLASFMAGGGILFFLAGLITGSHLPWHIDTTMYSVFFFHLGYTCRALDFEKLKEKVSLSMTVMLVGIFLFASSQLFPLYPFNTSENRFAFESLTLVMNLLAIASLLLVCTHLKNNRYFDYLGKNSLLLYYIQIPFLSYIYDAIDMFVIDMKIPYIDNSIMAIIYVFMITLILYPIVKLLNKFPILSGKGKVIENLVYTK